MRRASLVSPAGAPLLAAVAFALAFIGRTAFTIRGESFFSLFDDAMISMRYGRNLAEGHGLVWNVGQAPVEGYSNLLWTLWMALLHLLRPSPSKASLLVMLSGALVLALNVVAIRGVVRRLAPEGRIAVPIACWLVALDHSLAYWTLRGFEVGLIALWISLAVSLALDLGSEVRRGKLGALALVMALGALTRDDTAPVWLVIGAYVALSAPPQRRWRIAALLGGTVIFTLAAHTALRQLYYGAPLPNTYYLKIHGIPALFRLRTGAPALAKTALFCLAVPLVPAAFLLRSRPRCRGAWLLASVFLVQCAYSVYAGGDAFEDELLVNRFVTCGLPCLFALAAMGLDAALSPSPPEVRRATLAGALALLGLSCAWSLRAAWVFGATDLRSARIAAAILAGGAVIAISTGKTAWRGALAGALVVAAQGPALVRWVTGNAQWADQDALMARYGVALREATQEEATIAVTWAGAIPYFARRTAIDIMGKCDPVIAREPPRPAHYFVPGHDKWDLDYSVGRLRPDVVAQVTEDSAALLGRFEEWGYIRVGPEVFARRGSRAVDPAALTRASCAVPWHMNNIWGYFGDLPDLWRERWLRECDPAIGPAPPE